MKLQIYGRHLEIRDTLKGYTRAKVKRLSRFSSLILSVDVLFDANRDSTYTAKVIVGLHRNRTIVCSEREKSATAALDLAMDAIERKLSAVKEKLHRRRNREKVARRLMEGEG